MMAAILNSTLLDSDILPKKNLDSFILTQLDDGSHLEFYHVGFSHFAKTELHSLHSDSTWWRQPSWILPSWTQTLPSWISTPCYLLSDSLKNTLPPLWLWLKLLPSDWHNDGNHLWIHPSWVLSSQADSAILHKTLVPTICTKKLKLIHSDSTWVMAAILKSAMLDSDTAILDSNTLLSSLRFTQKHSSSILTLTQTNSIWLKLIHSEWMWWWQPSWILPYFIQTPCYLLSDSLKNTLTPLWLWLKLIQSDSNSFILT